MPKQLPYTPYQLDKIVRLDKYGSIGANTGVFSSADFLLFQDGKVIDVRKSGGGTKPGPGVRDLPKRDGEAVPTDSQGIAGEAYTSGNKPRYRDQVLGTNSWEYRDWHGNFLTGSQSVRVVESLLISRGNPKKKGYYRSGGDFYCEKVTQWGKPDITRVTGYKAPSLGGGFRFTQKNSLVDTSVIKTIFPVPTSVATARTILKSTGNQYEATGRARVDPFRPAANTGQNLVELIRDVPSLVGRGLVNWLRGNRSLNSLPRVIAGEYLNLQFGVLPSVEDFVKGVALLLEIDKLRQKLYAEANRPIRRSKTLVNETTVEILDPGTVGPFAGGHGEPLDGSSGASVAKTTRTAFRVTRTKVWYVAKLSYFLPYQTPLQDILLNAKLGGLEPNLANIWSVTPWSWLPGWFSNLNDVVRNISSSMVNNIVLHYSYVMKEEELTTYTTYTHELEWPKNGDANTPSGNDVKDSTWWVVRYNTKSRVGGTNPFGLYVGIDGLDSFKVSILAALGLSRSRVSSK